MTTKRFKELKWEIKEKAELVENLKQIVDTKLKRVVEIDFKINEEIDIIRQVEEQWLQNVRSVAEGLDAASAELSRTFIGPEERPFVGIPEPVVEDIEPRKISAEEARRAEQKIAFADGRLGIMSKEAAEFDELVHNLHRSGGKEVTVRGAVKKGSARRKGAVSKSRVKRAAPRRKRT